MAEKVLDPAFSPADECDIARWRYPDIGVPGFLRKPDDVTTEGDGHQSVLVGLERCVAVLDFEQIEPKYEYERAARHNVKLRDAEL